MKNKFLVVTFVALVVVVGRCHVSVINREVFKLSVISEVDQSCTLLLRNHACFSALNSIIPVF